ncbi:hypothetical protein [Prevotella dentasini]|uniref:hypothetical protein n=1 Tax=Prevotella dentasini TaxID=589537 RepID=UPI00046A0299|nr:hypothetical protein [Prevotella dentasini]
MRKNLENGKMAELFEKAKWGTALADDEVSFLREQLHAINTCDWKQNSTIKLHLGILSFGLCVEPNQHNKELIEKFINTDSFDDSIVASAIKVLCLHQYWNLAASYKDVLHGFIDWDNDMYEETRAAAINCMGDYLHTTQDKEEILYLLSKYDYAIKGSTNEDKSLIRLLYEAFQIILWGNKYPKERIICVWDMKVPKDISSSVINRVRQMGG